MKTRITLALCVIVFCGSLCDEEVTNKSRKKRFNAISVVTSIPEIFRELSDIWHVLLRDPQLTLKGAILRSKEHEIIGRITAVNKNVLRLENRVNRIYGEVLNDIVSTLPNIVKTELKLDLMAQIMDEIDIAKTELRDYLSSVKVNKTFEDGVLTTKDENLSRDSHSITKDMENDVNAYEANFTTTESQEKTAKIERSTLLAFATWATGPGADSVKTLLGRLHRIICPKNEPYTGLFHLLADRNMRLQHSKTIGNTELSEQMRITYELLEKLWERLSESNNIDQNMLPQDLIQHFIDIDDNITRIESGMSQKDFYILSSMWNYAQVEADIMSINSYYDTFKKLQDNVKRSVALSQLAWTDLAETFLQNNEFGLIKITDRLHHHVTDSDPSNLFELARQDLGTTICNIKQSTHQVLYNLYNAVTMADYKGYIMLQFSYMILRLYGKGNFTAEAERETQKFEQRNEAKSTAIRNALANADRSKYNCDPKQYVEGLNYVRLTKLLQGYIENEVNLNPSGACWENCAYYYYTEYYGCFKEQFCSKQEQCRGKVVECKYVDSDMTICKSSDQERRYDWVEYENSNVLGTKGKCQARNLFKVDSWWRYLFWHCSYCLCLCDSGNHNSDRYFNLRKVTSDIEQNKVVTGVKIIKHNGIIHLQIQQGTLKPRGVIDKSTLSWKPVDNYTIYDKNVENGIDYHTMNWMDRIIDTDEAVGPNEHVLTGIRLRKIGHHLNLEIRTTPINFTTGEVYPEAHSLWQGNENTEITISTPRKEIILTNPDIPIRNGPHTIDSQHNQYIKFQATSFESDVAQNTVPYLDGQPIISHGFPLSGFGLIHRGKPGSGGFIAPKVITYNFIPHV